MRSQTRFLAGLDTAMLLLTSVLMSVSLTGLPLHEWLGFILCPLVLLHVNCHSQWYLDQFRRLLTAGAFRARINFLLNIALLVMMAALLVSGIRLSHQLSPIIGESIGRRQVWHDIHNWSSVAVMCLVSLHLGLNWDWIVAVIRRCTRKTPPLPKDPVSNIVLPTISSQNFGNFFAKTVVIVGLTVLATLAVYVPTAAMTPASAIRTPAMDQPNLTTRTAANPGNRAPQGRRPQTQRGLMLFASTLLGAVAVAVVARYVFRLHL